MVGNERQIAIGVPKESYPGERRVAVIPEVVPLLAKEEVNTFVEAGAGAACGFSDDTYRDKGAQIISSREQLFQSCDMILQVRAVGANSEAGKADLRLFRSGQIIIGHFEPLSLPQVIQQIAPLGVTTFAIELLPRITRAQGMDALSSMATVSGYKAVLLAAEVSRKMFPLLMTAAGTVSPAHVFVIGAGVAGLQAIATARRLGAVVQAYDIRPAVKEQVESLGAKFVELELEAKDAEDKGGYARAMDEEFYRRQRELMANVMAASDVVITTAAVPGKKPPILITEKMVKRMSPGSVIVDLAAERGGNCELTRPGETVEANGVTILGPLNLPATVPYHASQMYSRNMLAFVRHLLHNGGMEPNLDDEIIRETMLTHKGEVINRQVRELLGLKEIPHEVAKE
ncbi:MAG: Re/Si-specific NAD(P)(+) transhydrogenase subunit alpha [Candidatus Zixiibacteriota bacterium]